jgi:translation initiation factor 3 subunit G
MSKATKKQWVDEDDDDEEAPVVTGIRDKVSFSENAKGQKVKTITKVRSKEIKTRIPKRILARRNLPRFGDAKSGEDNVTLVSKDIIAIEHPDDQLVEDAADDPTIKNTLASFIQKQQERSLMRDFEDDLEPGADDDKMGREEPTGKGGDGKYVPPAERMRLASGAPKQDLDQESTLRVSNLTKSVTEDDLRDLFEPFGRVLRVSLPRIERTENGQTWKEPRGFAYIAFVRKEDAEVALERLQGHGYDHLILKLEWAKPTRPDGGGGREGLSGGFVSGYGQKLAQDTKEKAVYASNLTGNSGSWMS